ncbi:MAG TPA: DUF58 domain-containing protein [Thiobacillaceae bacterium]|nr:DUF58 domain-containing protein [Thiobacillaceae bacterium]HNU63513.1 DUF58 domain-containing protein [Thiobacillaceae bacterium]
MPRKPDSSLSFLPLRSPLLRRIFRLPAAEPLPFILGARRIYILPTRQGLVFGLLLLGMLLGSMNYGLSMGFLFTFLLAGMLLSTLFSTWRGLLGLRLTGIEAESGFMGESVGFVFQLEGVGAQPGPGLFLESAGQRVPVQVRRPGFALAPLRLPARQRGRQALGPCRLFSEAPLGLFRAWCVLAPAVTVLVWPKPVPRGRPLPASGMGVEEAAVGRQRGTEDFDGLTAYQPGESPARLAWKHLGRLPEPLVKTFVSPHSDALWLDWSRLAGMETEQRLAQLARWVLRADQAGLSYGLILPASRIPPASGPGQRLRCLNALALHGLPDPESHAAV